jgi:hypothetical protein
MRNALNKFLVFVLSVGLTVGSPVLSHAGMAATADVAVSHEHNVVQHYADLVIDPANADCPHAAPQGTHHQDDGLCKKCCSACLGASLIPTTPVAIVILSGPRDALFTPDDSLVACAVPTEPGIPKPL